MALEGAAEAAVIVGARDLDPAEAGQMGGQELGVKQREAARNVSESIASLGPTLAMVAPDFMDAVSGEKGSVQAMAGQMMEANRYRADPITGKMGYSTESNKNLVNNVFENMYRFGSFVF